MNKRSTGPVIKGTAAPPGEASGETGKVVRFPERSCSTCAFAEKPGCAQDPHPVLAGLKPHSPYAGFSHLPAALQRWRGRRGLKISAAAQGLGVAASTWGHWETGFRFPTGSVLLDLVQYTGLSLAELICAHGEHCPLLQTNPAGGRPALTRMPENKIS